MTLNELVLTHKLTGPHPDTWDDFVGQDAAKRQLQVAATTAKSRDTRMAHTLLASTEPGIGKTTLALLTAAERGTTVQIATGMVDLDTARGLLADMSDGDVLVLDEADRLVHGGAHTRWLQSLVQSGWLTGPCAPEVAPDVTVIATVATDVATLPDEVVSCFPLRPPLAAYSEDEALLIAAAMAQRILLRPLPWPHLSEFRAIARAANNNPRTIGAILSNLRDIALVDAAIHDGERYDLTEACGWLDLSEDGLTAAAREYLRVLATEMGGRAGEKAMAKRLGEPGGIRGIESVLLRRGYIARTKQGRILTGAGIRRAREEL